MKKRKNRGLGRKIVLLGTALCLILSGCQQGTPQKEEEGAAEEKPATSWNEKWKVVYTDKENNSVDINMWMKCIIMIPENEPDSIVEVSGIEFDSQYKEKLVRAVFGDEAYLYDAGHMTKAALLKELGETKENLASCNERIREMKEDSHGSMEVDLPYARKRQKFLKEKIKNMKLSLKKATDEPVPVTEGNYSSDSYFGYINGTAYRLEFNGQRAKGIVGWGSDWEYQSSQAVTLEPIDIGEVAPAEFASADEIFYSGGHKNVENRCSLTNVEALEEAKAFLKKLGFDYMVETSGDDLVWTDNPDLPAGILEGYRFFLKTGMNGVPFSNKGALPSVIGEDFAEVCVTDKGVVALRLNSPIEVKSITPDVQLLDFEDIKDMLRTQMADYIREIIQYEDRVLLDSFGQYGNDIEIRKMELCYCRMESPEKKGEYAYVPAWNLDDFMVINAIDGSFIGT